jgi:hypothetical protein
VKFDARVLGIPTHLGIARKLLPRDDAALESEKLQAAESALMQHVPHMRVQIAEFFQRPGECISHVRCDRFGFLLALQEYACFLNGTTVEEVLRENAYTDYLHMVLMGQADAIIVPFEFNVPLRVRVLGRRHPYMVCSLHRIVHEIEMMDEYTAIQQTIGIKQFDAFVALSNADMERFEKHQGVGRRFWAKWGLAALRGVVMRALKNQLPVIVDPQHGDLPITE